MRLGPPASSWSALSRFRSAWRARTEPSPSCRNQPASNVIWMGADSRALNGGGVETMQYMLAIYGDERVADSMPREQMTEIINAYMSYTQALRDAKVLVGSNRLRPTSA